MVEKTLNIVFSDLAMQKMQDLSKIANEDIDAFLKDIEVDTRHLDMRNRTNVKKPNEEFFSILYNF